MIILALDSALSSCSAAVVKDGEILSEIFEMRLRGQAERLVPMCQEACLKAGLSFAELDAIAVTCGPGTFTGVRIGLAAAKGLALALDVPLVGISTLEVTARNMARNAFRDMAECQIAVAHDARRSEVYFQLFDLKNDHVIAASQPLAVPLCDMGQHLDDRVTAVVGTGAGLVKSCLPDKVTARLNFPEMVMESNGGTVGRIACDRIASGDQIEEVVPLYLRPPDAVAPKPITYPFQNQ